MPNRLLGDWDIKECRDITKNASTGFILLHRRSNPKILWGVGGLIRISRDNSHTGTQVESKSMTTAIHLNF